LSAEGVSIGEALAAYLTAFWGASVTVENLTRIPGGASRETYSFDAVKAGGERRGLILRRDPTGSLIDTDRTTEFLAYQSFQGLAPVPEPIVLEAECGPLERPFFIMSRVDGGTASSPFAPDPYAPHAEVLGRELFAILGRIAGADPHVMPIARAFTAPALDACWSRELDYWEEVIFRDELHPQPIVRAALRRLRHNPPPPAQKLSVVHGDYRSGNFLHDGRGRVLAILDWEMAHLGDPLEDLAWCLDPLWSHFDESRAAGTLPTAEAIRIWKAESGLEVDLKAFAWWRLFNSVKGQGIWTTSAKTFAEGGHDLVLGFSGLYTARRHDQIIADQLGRLVVEEGWA
jgi:aminoglycoside phosphotransferase (APT) family kinase protein